MPPTENSFWLPDYSPDGKQLVFCHDMTGAMELYVINVDGTGLQQVTHDGTENLGPRWSPDGTHIVFATLYNPDFGAHHLATIRPDGSERTVLTNVPFDDYQPEYTSDGTHIVFGSSTDNLISALWIEKANGRDRRRITRPAFKAGGPDVSPDGEHIAFYDNWNTLFPGNTWVGRVDGTHLRRVAPLTGNPSYSPDGSKIALNDINGNLVIMNSDGSNAKVVLSCELACFSPDWGAHVK